ncbi:ComEC/Rec2 family competence protein [Clostridium senegalense]|uniref:MBL fold metallo-hydrolase n=1 Tax=Clostridium senegalense TaxID=1465809 RepID=A0A6M0H577_9CLOT|nr:ComEC/Rec2 family competence protein [Clostridium senegalense]NEU04732.1 MBL fold metallo-hydrolase [Clostridium senegalense]
MKNKWKIRTIISLLLVFMVSFLMIGCEIEGDISDRKNTKENNLTVSFIDVGQADSILIQCGNETMLIDAGNNDDGKIVENHLKKMNVSKIDYLVGTHPHEDHIGPLDYVIDNFKIGTVYMPKKTATTKTFKDVVNSLNKKGLKPIAPKVGDTFNIGSAKATIIAPAEDYKDANESSIVIKIQYEDTSFLFAGDAETLSENDMLKSGTDLSADVLKLAHHGSRTSSSDKFLDKVNPKYAIISCEKNNDYGHPHIETINKMKNRNIIVHRTDEEGTIIATSDGKNISFDKNNGTYNEGAKVNLEQNDEKDIEADSISENKNENDMKVYFTEKGKSYHLDKDCSSLKNSKNILMGTLKEAKDKGKSDPCDRCAL